MFPLGLGNALLDSGRASGSQLIPASQPRLVPGGLRGKFYSIFGVDAPWVR